MKLRLAALLFAAAAPAFGAASWTTHRADLILHVSGTVVPDDVFRLKSTIEGRVETMNTSTNTWRRADEPLATLATKEFAAMLEVHGAQDEDVMAERWSRVYHPTPVRCPVDCYVLKAYVKAHAPVKPQAVLFEAATKLKLVGRARPEVAPLIREGMEVTFWSARDPKRKLTGTVARFGLDSSSENAFSGGTFTVDLNPDNYFDPGTQWEGEIVPLTDVMIVPTPSLIIRDGIPYLPIRVSTGLTTPNFTQITGGIDEGREIMVPDYSLEDSGAARRARTPDRGSIELRRHAPDRAAAPERPKAPAAAGEKGYGGEDPYGDQ